MKKLLISLALLIPACIPQLACTPAQLQRFEAARATLESDCKTAQGDYEAAKSEYLKYSAEADAACAEAKLLPDAIGEVSLVAVKRGACLKTNHLDAAAERVQSTAQTVTRICAAVEALGTN
jgi:hypothetical protein